LPLLISHDGPEMDGYGGLTAYVAALVAAGTLPPMRVALLSPGPRRNQRYAANPAYARALSGRVVPALTEAVATTGRPVLMGQSLGALSALHAAWSSPATFGGLFLQSGSFFTPELDPQESGFELWREVTGFVASVLASSLAAPGAPPITLTCGAAEEKPRHNIAMRDHLAAVGIETGWGEVRDGHTWTLLARHPRPVPHRPAHAGVGVTSLEPGRTGNALAGPGPVWKAGPDGTPPGRARRARIRPAGHGDPVRPTTAAR
jgi:enterochelin esterase family protein